MEVVESMKEHIGDFYKGWRQHFIYRASLSSFDLLNIVIVWPIECDFLQYIIRFFLVVLFFLETVTLEAFPV